MSTEFDPEAIKKAAGELGAIMDDMSAFGDLKIAVPNAGSFEVAKWLDNIVRDRGDGVVGHAEHFQVALDDMETTLTQIATDFADADGENADKITTSIASLQTEVGSDISSYDSNLADPEPGGTQSPG